MLRDDQGERRLDDTVRQVRVHISAVWPQEHILSTLSLTFSICQIGKISPASQHGIEECRKLMERIASIAAECRGRHLLSGYSVADS